MRRIKPKGLLLVQHPHMTNKFLAILIGLAFSAHAQNYIDPIKLYYSTSPSHFKGDNSGQSTAINEIGTELLIPFPIENGHAIITGLNVEQTSLRPHPNSPTLNLYTINPRVGMNIKHSEKWTGLYVLLPQIASDLKRLDGDDMQLGGISILTYTKRKNLKYKVGAYYNSALYGPALFALAGFYYQSPSENWTFDFSLPVYADIQRKLTDKWSSGIRFDAMLRSYYINEPILSSDNEYIVKSTQELFLYTEYSISKNFVAAIKVGHSILRSYRMFAEGDKVDLAFTGINFGNNRTQLNSDITDGPILQLRLHYRFHLEDQ